MDPKRDFGHKVSGPLEVVSRTSYLQLDAGTKVAKQSGRRHKATRPLEIISRHSRSSQINISIDSIVPPMLYYLSLHNQAYVMKSPAPNNECTKPEKKKSIYWYPLWRQQTPRRCRKAALPLILAMSSQTAVTNLRAPSHAVSAEAR